MRRVPSNLSLSPPLSFSSPPTLPSASSFLPLRLALSASSYSPPFSSSFIARRSPPISPGDSKTYRGVAVRGRPGTSALLWPPSWRPGGGGGGNKRQEVKI